MDGSIVGAKVVQYSVQINSVRSPRHFVSANSWCSSGQKTHPYRDINILASKVFYLFTLRCYSLTSFCLRIPLKPATHST